MFNMFNREPNWPFPIPGGNNNPFGNFNIREIVKNHALRLIWSWGWTLRGKDSDFIAKILEAWRAEISLPALSGVLFDQGHAIIVIRKTLTGELKFSMPLLWGSSSVAKVFEEENLLVVWERIKVDDLNIIMKTVYDDTKTQTFFYHNGEGGVMDEAYTQGESVKIANKLNIPIIDNHNLGIVPALFIPNLPTKNFTSNFIGEWYPDDTPSGDKLQEVQQHLEFIRETIEWELEANRTRFFQGLTSAQIEEIKKDPSKYKIYLNNFMVFHMKENMQGSSMGLSGNNPQNVNIIQGNPQLGVYANYWNFTWNRGFNLCGYDSPFGNKEHGTNKTSDEVSINGQNDINSTSLKKNILENQLNRLFQKAFIAGGIKNGECVIEIHAMSNMEKNNFPENIYKRFEMGLISRAEAIAKLDKVSLKIAEAKAKEIEKEQQKLYALEDKENEVNSE